MISAGILVLIATYLYLSTTLSSYIASYLQSYNYLNIFIQIPSSGMVSVIPQILNYVKTDEITLCNGISVIYGLPAILSMLFATMLLIVDFIIPCITNKKVIRKLYYIYRLANCKCVAYIACN